MEQYSITSSVTVLVMISLTISNLPSTISSSDHDHIDSWCDYNVDVFHELQSLANSTGDVISSADLHRLITDAFYRMSCDELQNISCQECLKVEHVFEALKSDPVLGLDGPQTEQASTIIVNFMANLVTLCPQSATWDWQAIDISNFTEYQMHFHGHENDSGHDEHYFSHHQLEEMMTEMNATYRPGEMTVEDDGTVYVENRTAVCLSDISPFRSGHIIKSSDLQDSIAGATDAELHRLNSVLLIRLLKGDCMVPDRNIVDSLPNQDEFIQAIYDEFGSHDANESCVITDEGFARILQPLKIGGGLAGGGDAPHEPHLTRAHVHAESTMTKEVVLRRSKRAIQTRENEGDHQHGSSGVSVACYSMEELLRTFYLDDHHPHITSTDFLALCPALIQQAAQGCLATVDHGHIPPSDVERYVYGTLAVVIIGLCSLFGLIVVRWRNKPVYNYILTLMLGLAIGSLVGDSLLHLIPHAMGLHDHSEGDSHSSGQIVVDENIWKLLCACGSIWLLFNVDLFLNMIHRHSHMTTASEEEEIEVASFYRRRSSTRSIGDPKGTAPNQDRPNHLQEDQNHYQGQENEAYDGIEKNVEGQVDIGVATQQQNGKLVAVESTSERSGAAKNSVEDRETQSAGWMVVIGDGIHNVVDGFAIGAAFSIDIPNGLATSVAVLCHEIPHEFGDTAIMLHSGWSTKKVAILQLVSASSALVGLYIGLAIGSDAAATSWILITTVGIFLYIGLTQVMPELTELILAQKSWKMIVNVNVGLFIGFGFMLIMAIFEDYIAF